MSGHRGAHQANDIYPKGCSEVNENLGSDEMMRRLKTLAHTFQTWGQAEVETTYTDTSLVFKIVNYEHSGKLIDELGGPENVSEMTVCNGRVVQDEKGDVRYESRSKQDIPLETLNLTEKDVAIISEAASSGISLQNRRVHMTLELPWSADRAIQQNDKNRKRKLDYIVCPSLKKVTKKMIPKINVEELVDSNNFERSFIFQLDGTTDEEEDPGDKPPSGPASPPPPTDEGEGWRSFIYLHEDEDLTQDWDTDQEEKVENRNELCGRSSGLNIQFTNQDYVSIKQGLSSGKLFEDDLYTEQDMVKGLKDKFDFNRCQAMFPNRAFYDKSQTAFSVQGQLPDCWIVSVIDTINQNDSLLQQIIRDDQNDDYSGLFRFKFHRMSRQIEIVVDDRLPCLNGHLHFLNPEGNFWPPLLEKALSKILGGYVNIERQPIYLGFVALTGGVVESFQLKQLQPNVWKTTLEEDNRRGSLMVAASFNQTLVNSLIIQNHVYAILEVHEIQTGSSKGTVVLKMRNPRGKEKYNGPFSHSYSIGWRDVNYNEKLNLGFLKLDQGCFFITLQSFLKEFTEIAICHLPDLDRTHSWKRTTIQSAWDQSNSGGCRNYASFGTNPQFELTVLASDIEKGATVSTVILSLTTDWMVLPYPEIGLRVFALKNVEQFPLSANILSQRNSFSRHPYSPDCMVTYRLGLPVGRYSIVASTFTPGVLGPFELQILKKNP